MSGNLASVAVRPAPAALGDRESALSVPLVPLAVLSGAALSLEVLLTKFLAYSVSAILVSVVLGIALVGFGAAGTVAAAYPAWASRGSLGRRLAWAALGFSWSTLVVFAVLVRVSSRLKDVDPTMFAVAALLTLPFFFAGLAVTFALKEGRVGRTYAANLVGSALGCVTPLLLLGVLGGERMIALLAAFGCLAAWGFSRETAEESGRGALGPAVPVTFVLVAVAAALAPGLYSPAPERAPFGQLQVVRDYVAARGGKERTLYDHWNAVGRIQIFGYDDVAGQLSPYPFLFYAQDSSAGSSLASWNGREQKDFQGAAPPGDVIAHACEETLWGQAYFAPRKRVLVIGLGGGMDVQCALYHGAESVDVVEINPDSIAAVRGRFNGWTGGIGTHPRVTYHLGDGRSFAHRLRAGGYDVIQLSGVDTKNAASSGGLALSENTLYTEEAFADYLRNLSRDGVLSIVRFSDAEAVRLSHTAVTALRHAGAAHPEDHVVVRDDAYVRGVIVRRSALAPEDVAAVERSLAPRGGGAHGVSIFFYEAMGMDFTLPPLLEYAPGRASSGAASQYLTAVASGTEAQFLRGYPFDVTPATDDRPFFFDVFRYNGLSALAYPHVRMLSTVLLSVLALGVGLLLLPMALSRLSAREVRPVAGVVFACVGLAYLFVEVWSIHRFSTYLGHQTYALGVVLFTLLLGTGIGARLGEARQGTTRTFLVATLGIVLTLTFGHVALPFVLDATTSMTFLARVAVTAVYVMGLGLLMGLPFPAGLAWARVQAPDAVPWYVGINGFASVTATLVVVPLSHAFGYEAVLLTGGGLYVAAAAASATMRDSRAQ